MPDLWTIQLTIRDAKDAESTHKFYLRTEEYTSWALARDYVWDYALRLDACIHGEIVGIDISRPSTVEAAIPEPDSDVEEQLKTRYLLHGTDKTWLHSIAAFDQAYTIPDEDDQKRYPSNDPAVIALRNLMTCARSMGYNSNPCSHRGEEIKDFKDAVIKFKRR